MRWNLKHTIKSYISGSMWLVPLFAFLFYAVFNRITHAVDTWLQQQGWLDETTAFFGLSMAGARSLLETVVTLNLSVLVVTFGSLLVAIQVAGGQYTPRIIATTLLRDNVIRFTVGCFVFTLAFALRVLSQMDEMVHQLNTWIAAMFGAFSIMVFLYLIDYAARMLRPISILQRVGEYGVAVIKTIYPEPTKRPRPVAPPRRLGSPKRTVVNTGAAGVVLAADLAGLVKQAHQANGVVEFVPNVGDFLAVDEPLFRLYGGAGAIDDRRLRESVALGTERTLEQDPTFAFRILVDIAIKALSSAINDPTTAVMAIDQVHRLLRLAGLRDLRDDELRDEAGQLRLVFRTPNWEDYVGLACTEIRHCGGGSVQVMRRMRSMLENLMQTLPPHRHAELHQQLELLDRTVERQYAFPEDRALARTADPQGLGGRLGMQPWADPPDPEDRRRDN
jgi:uncharacterized membrane protein